MTRGTQTSSEVGTGKPNIVFIMADDMGYGDLSCYGATKIATPHMDGVAADGMRFTDAHSASSVCTPSRYSVLTGRYCWRTWRKGGVGGGFSLPLIDPARQTVASLLRGSDYATAAVGKWHVGLEWQARAGTTINPETWQDEGNVDYTKPIIGGPLALGFDTFFGIAGSLDMPPYCFIEDDRTVGLPCEEKEPYNAQQREGFMTPGWNDEDVDATFARKAVDFIEAHHARETHRPFFLYLTPSAPHRPCMPPDFVKGRSQAGPRGDMVMVVDWLIGEVTRTLERLGLADNTLLIVTSDNGAQPCDVDGNTHGHKSCGALRGFKAAIWEGGHRVPFIARWPGRITPGTVCEQTICLADFMATCADVLGAALPPHAGEDSTSLLPLLLGEDGATSDHEAIVHHSCGGMFAIRHDEWKLILGRGDGGFGYMTGEARAEPDEAAGQLYNLAKDLAETENLWTGQPEQIDRLGALLAQYKESGRSAPHT